MTRLEILEIVVPRTLLFVLPMLAVAALLARYLEKRRDRKDGQR
jgi:hypothetical protein